jgi:hypothetical protein
MKGILFKPDMIRAIMEGRKTQTRRLIRLPKAPNHLGVWEPTTIGGEGDRDSHGNPVPEIPAIWHTRTGKCLVPKYLPSETVYVKEAWLHGVFENLTLYKIDWDNPVGKWNSPMFMPEKYARTFLLIKEVKPQRIQEITEEDAWAEGLYDSYDPIQARVRYADLWDFINKVKWADNPWVWRYEFEVLNHGI